MRELASLGQEHEVAGLTPDHDMTVARQAEARESSIVVIIDCTRGLLSRIFRELDRCNQVRSTDFSLRLVEIAMI